MLSAQLNRNGNHMGPFDAYGHTAQPPNRTPPEADRDVGGEGGSGHLAPRRLAVHEEHVAVGLLPEQVQDSQCLQAQRRGEDPPCRDEDEARTMKWMKREFQDSTTQSTDHNIYTTAMEAPK